MIWGVKRVVGRIRIGSMKRVTDVVQHLMFAGFRLIQRKFTPVLLALSLSQTVEVR